MLLDGKVTIVSGVGAGVGREVALACARDGSDLALAARTEAMLEAVADEVRALGRRAITVPMDLTKPEQCAQLVARTVAELGGVDVLVNNAAASGRNQRIESADLSRFRLPFEVNVFGTLELTQAVIPAMKERGGGSIVMVNSLSMRRPQDDSNAAYGASKAALASFTRSLAFELGQYNIRANGVVPNWIWGPNVEQYFAAQAKERGVDPQVVYDEVASRTALKRLTTSADVADAVVFLASERARAISGISLDINSGEYFPG